MFSLIFSIVMFLFMTSSLPLFCVSLLLIPFSIHTLSLREFVCRCYSISADYYKHYFIRLVRKIAMYYLSQDRRPSQNLSIAKPTLYQLGHLINLGHVDPTLRSNIPINRATGLHIILIELASYL